ncbi:MAG TPA: tRNA lysidine(34) synthetase TilS [Sphingomonadaceae bacterium]|nr:tRNA lysidine(34) synthetase TilS [Sphingomonadaceae bacterium]
MPADEQVARFREDLESLAGAASPLALAVSGGPDSLALLLLAAAAFPGRIAAATVDHNLRREAAAEATLVARYCNELGVPHETLAVKVAPAGEGLQAAARDARYAALAGWMAERGVPVLLTGHHLDDQAETLLMRLGRASGVAGLAGIRASAPLPGGGTVHRPLLGWRRAELAGIVAAARWEAVSDPGNSDERFARTQIRRHLARSPWLDPPALARSAAALADAEEALQRFADDLAPARITRREGDVLLDVAGIPAEIARRLLLRCLRLVAPDAAPRGDQLTSLLGSLARGGTTTLAGVKCSGGKMYRFVPAAPRTQGTG